MRVVQLKMIEARFWPKMKFEPIFFQVFWQFFNLKGSLLRQRRTGSKRGRAKIPGGDGTPTSFLFARPSDWILKSRIRIFVKKCSNFVQKTPPVGKCLCWLALCEGSPADFKRKLEFFIFAPLLRGWPKAGFPNFHF